MEVVFEILFNYLVDLFSLVFERVVSQDGHPALSFAVNRNLVRFAIDVLEIHEFETEFLGLFKLLIGFGAKFIDISLLAEQLLDFSLQCRYLLKARTEDEDLLDILHSFLQLVFLNRGYFTNL